MKTPQTGTLTSRSVQAPPFQAGAPVPRLGGAFRRSGKLRGIGILTISQDPTIYVGVSIRALLARSQTLTPKHLHLQDPMVPCPFL